MDDLLDMIDQQGIPPRREPLVLGLAGWSGSGKTTLIRKLLPVLTARGLRVATLKHAHHEFDIDLPGKDSWEHRRAGASEVIVSSATRWVQMHELHGEAEPSLAELLQRVSRCDLILIEGFKRERHPKLEVHRPSLGEALLSAHDTQVVAIAADAPVPAARIPVIDLNDTMAVAEQVLAGALPLSEVLTALRLPR